MKWYRQKTTWTGIGAIITAVSAYLTGSIELSAAIQAAFAGLMVIFLRQGVAKIEPTK